MHPKPRSYRYTPSPKVKAFSDEIRPFFKGEGKREIIVLDSLKLDEPKTKEMAKVLENVKAAKKALIVTDVKDENVVRSAANIPGVKTTIVGEMNVYDIVNHTSLILTKDAVTRIEGGVFIMTPPTMLSSSLSSRKEAWMMRLRRDIRSK